MAPVIAELSGRGRNVDGLVCVTGQHRNLLDQVLSTFSIQPDFDLDIMRDKQTLAGITSTMVSELQQVIQTAQPDWILVQGDTSSAMCAALCAFYNRIKIAHVEAGLRTYQIHNPFPEEANRRIIGLLANLHFAPTERARSTLLSEGVTPESVHLTGNTIVDALHWTLEQAPRGQAYLSDVVVMAIKGGRLLLVTAHRRENHGAGLEELCKAITQIVAASPDVVVVFPVHPNPAVADIVNGLLDGVRRVHLLAPLPHDVFVWLENNAYLIVTDSGGVQEEAACLGKPTLIIRTATDRPEAVDAKNARIVGTEKSSIASAVLTLLNNVEDYSAMCGQVDVYGDGNAARRIVDLLLTT